MAANRPEPVSMLLVEEYFDREDDRFVDALRGANDWRALSGFAGRWKKDHRPWARRQILRYVDFPLDCLGHQPVVRQLFKQAEENRDDELMAAFLVAFDSLVRYERRSRWQYDPESRQSWQDDVLRLPRNVLPLDRKVKTHDTFSRRTKKVAARVRPGDRLFRHRTRYYLRRRAWRYFRHMGFSRPGEYCRAVSRALVRYVDESLGNGEDILESWGLMHVCFGRSDRLEKTATHITLKEGASLADLKPSPFFPRLWDTDEGFAALLDVLKDARSQLVRMWSAQFLEAEHGERLENVDVKALIPLLAHDDSLVSQFAARHFSRSTQLASLPLAAWLELLQARNDETLDLICQAMSRNVHFDRLSLADCVRLACAAPVPVSRMGLEWLKLRRIDTTEDRLALRACARSQCVATGGELAQWALSQFESPGTYDREIVTAFMDSLNAGCRAGAWSWLAKENSPGRDDPALWLRLVETPYDDVRLPLVRALQQRTLHTGLSTDALTPVWSSVLLGVHRGGREKLKAIAQIRDALLQQPERLEQLLPVLRVAVRSVRGPEMAAGLSAIVSIATIRPELDSAIRGAIPELRFEEETG